MKQILKLKLDSKFRNPISVESEESIYHGRTRELGRLRSLLNTRQSASVLISGLRGIGKTAFVREAVRLVTKKDKKEFAFIDLTLANIEAENIRKAVLKSIIRGLYHNKQIQLKLAGEDAFDQLEAIYRKTYYLEVKETGILEVSKKDITINEEKNISERKWSLGISPLFIAIAKYISLSIIMGIVGWVTVNLLPFLTHNLLGFVIAFILFSILIIVFLLLISKLEFNNTKENRTENQDEGIAKMTKSGIGEYDLSADTLEIILKQILGNLHTLGHKVVFVIDELDKIDNETKDLKGHLIYKIVCTFKNLFSLSNAIFIFITSSEFYDLVESERENNPYSSVHTLFTDRIFLNSMYFSDISNIIDSFLENPPDKSLEIQFKKFKSYISWKAKNHIFDTHNLIEGYTEYSDEGVHVVVYEQTQSKHGNIEEYWENAAIIEQYIVATFDEKLYLNNARKNERLYLALREVGEIIHRDSEVRITNRRYINIIPSERRTLLGLEDIDGNEKEDLEGAIQDFLLRTDRFGFTESISEVVKTEDGKDQQIVTFEIVSDEFRDLEDIKKVTVMSDFEKEFVDKNNELTKIVSSLDKVGLNNLVTPHLKEVNQFKAFQRLIEKEETRIRRKSQILDDKNRIEQIISSLKTSAIKELIKKISTDLGLTEHKMDTSPAGQSMWDYDPNLASFYQKVHDDQALTDKYEVFSSSSVNLVVGYDLEVDVQKRYIDISPRQRMKSSTKCLNISLSGVVNEKRNWGWRVFELNKSLSNLSTLEKRIKEYFK